MTWDILFWIAVISVIYLGFWLVLGFYPSFRFAYLSIHTRRKPRLRGQLSFGIFFVLGAGWIAIVPTVLTGITWAQGRPSVMLNTWLGIASATVVINGFLFWILRQTKQLLQSALTDEEQTIFLNLRNLCTNIPRRIDQQTHHTLFDLALMVNRCQHQFFRESKILLHERWKTALDGKESTPIDPPEPEKNACA